MNQAKTALCVFELDGTRYSVPLAAVQEFVRMPALTVLPDAPVVIAGVINLRGQAIAVVDLRRRFNMPVRQAALSDYLVIVYAANRLVGLWVDGASGICEVPAEWITNTDNLLDNTVLNTPGYIAGVAKLPDGLVLIHDLSRLLADSERLRLDSALAADALSAEEQNRS